MSVVALYSIQNNNEKNHFKVIDVSLLHSAMLLAKMLVSEEAIDESNSNVKLLNGTYSRYKMYQTKNDKHVFFGALEDKLFLNFSQPLGVDKSIMQKTNDEQIRFLEKIFLTKTDTQWDEFGSKHDCCISRLPSIKDVILDHQINALGLIKHSTKDELIHVGFPAGFTSESYSPQLNTTVPELGEHTDEILGELEC